MVAGRTQRRRQQWQQRARGGDSYREEREYRLVLESKKEPIRERSAVLMIGRSRNQIARGVSGSASRCYDNPPPSARMYVCSPYTYKATYLPIKNEESKHHCDRQLTNRAAQVRQRAEGVSLKRKINGQAVFDQWEPAGRENGLPPPLDNLLPPNTENRAK